MGNINLVSNKSLTLFGAFIWSIIVLLILFWHLDLFDLLNPQKVRDSESASFFISIVRLHTQYIFVTVLASASIILLASFKKKLGKPLLIFEGILAALAVFFMITARFSECEGLGCIGPGLFIFYSSFILTFVAFSAPFILHIIIFKDVQIVRKVSVALLILLTVLGSYLYFVYPNTLLKAGDEKVSSDVSNFQQEFSLLLFKPNYIPDGNYIMTEKVLDYTESYELFYYTDGLDKQFRIIQSRPQGKFDEYLNNSSYNKKEIRVKGDDAILLSFVVSLSEGRNTAKLATIKSGTEIEIIFTANSPVEEVVEEVVKIAESLEQF